MGFVKTAEELERYYGLGVRRFPGARMMGVMFGAERETMARLLPPPLEQADLPGGLIFVAEYPKTNLGPGYHEAALFLRCKHKGVAGSYCLSMPIDSEPRMHNGRDVFGFPKKLAKIGFERDGNRVRGWVERYGITFVEITITLAGTLPQLPPMGPTYLFKAMPRIDLTPGFDGPVLLAAQRTDMVAKKVEVGMAEVVLRPARHDPWSEIGTPEVMAAFCLESDNTMQPGKIIGEVDALAYLPHYYKFTDFSTGAEEEQ
jgi:acetoacetate decarboxylase